MTPSELASLSDPSGLTPETHALWLVKNGTWDAAHNVAQDIHTRYGSWIHALLHLIEGDIGNAHYWFARAGKTAVKVAEIEALWEEIANEILALE